MQDTATLFERVPNAFACIEIKAIIRTLGFINLFIHTAVILNTPVLASDWLSNRLLI